MMEQLYAGTKTGSIDSRELISPDFRELISTETLISSGSMGNYKIIKPVKMAEKSTETVLSPENRIYCKIVKPIRASGVNTGTIDSDATLGGVYQAKAVHSSKANRIMFLLWKRKPSLFLVPILRERSFGE